MRLSADRHPIVQRDLRYIDPRVARYHLVELDHVLPRGLPQGSAKDGPDKASMPPPKSVVLHDRAPTLASLNSLS
ncbi:hypothetical protein NL676_019900 [Syzygium grande]|nr:hypothetical protein NL676_019900 [Syzygium grande]